MNSMSLTLDPACPDPAAFLVRRLVSEIQQHSPGRPIQFEVKDWQPAVLTAAQEAGCRVITEMHSLGLKL